MHVLALMLIFAGSGGSSRSVAEAAVIRLVFADEVDEAQQERLRDWKRRIVPICVSGNRLVFGPIGGALAGGVVRMLPRCERSDDVWGDAAPPLQRGALHQRQASPQSQVAQLFRCQPYGMG